MMPNDNSAKIVIKLDDETKVKKTEEEKIPELGFEVSQLRNKLESKGKLEYKRNIGERKEDKKSQKKKNRDKLTQSLKKETENNRLLRKEINNTLSYALQQLKFERNRAKEFAKKNETLEQELCETLDNLKSGKQVIESEKKKVAMLTSNISEIKAAREKDEKQYKTKIAALKEKLQKYQKHQNDGYDSIIRQHEQDVLSSVLDQETKIYTRATSFNKNQEREEKQKKILTADQHAELRTYVRCFNMVLFDDPYFSDLQITENEPERLLYKLRDGLIIAKFINKGYPGIINEEELVSPNDAQRMLYNLDLCINGAKAIGISIKDELLQDKLYNTTDPVIVLKFLDSLVKKHNLSMENSKNIQSWEMLGLSEKIWEYMFNFENYNNMTNWDDWILEVMGVVGMASVVGMVGIIGLVGVMSVIGVVGVIGVIGAIGCVALLGWLALRMWLALLSRLVRLMPFGQFDQSELVNIDCTVADTIKNKNLVSDDCVDDDILPDTIFFLFHNVIIFSFGIIFFLFFFSWPLILGLYIPSILPANVNEVGISMTSYWPHPVDFGL